MVIHNRCEYYLTMLIGLECLTPSMIRGGEPIRPVEHKGGHEATVEITKGTAMTFCWIPPGEVQLGSPVKEREEVFKLLSNDSQKQYYESEAEEKRGKFKTNGFWLGKYPVTQEQWQALLANNPSRFSKLGIGGKQILFPFTVKNIISGEWR